MQEAGYDVYVNEPQMLAEGEEKHIISVFVADESGIINRVAGVFARRGVPPSLCAAPHCSICLVCGFEAEAPAHDLPLQAPI